MQNLQFKWGTLKGWAGIDGKALDILKEYFADGVPMSCAADRPNEERREVLCRLIDEVDGEFYNEWEGKEMTKEEAKKYVMGYNK